MTHFTQFYKLLKDSDHALVPDFGSITKLHFAGDPSKVYKFGSTKVSVLKNPKRKRASIESSNSMALN